MDALLFKGLILSQMNFPQLFGIAFVALCIGIILWELVKLIIKFIKKP